MKNKIYKPLGRLTKKDSKISEMKETMQLKSQKHEGS